MRTQKSGVYTVVQNGHESLKYIVSNLNVLCRLLYIPLNVAYWYLPITSQSVVISPLNLLNLIHFDRGALKYM